MDELILISSDPYNLKLSVNKAVDYICNVDDDQSLDQSTKEKYTCAIKKLVFVKYIYEQLNLSNDNKFRKILSDSLFVLDSLSINRERVVYFALRSLIESIARFFADDQDSSIRHLLDSFKERFPEEFGNIKGYYGKYCNYVHNNENMRNQNIYNYLEEFHSCLISRKDKRRMLTDFSKILETLILCLYKSEYADKIQALLYRQNYITEHLLGNSLYNKLYRIEL